MSDEATGTDGVTEAIPALEDGVLPFKQYILVAHILGSLIDDPGPTIHSNGIAAAEVGAELRTVAAAFKGAALEVLVLIEGNLKEEVSVRDT